MPLKSSEFKKLRMINTWSELDLKFKNQNLGLSGKWKSIVAWLKPKAIPHKFLISSIHDDTGLILYFYRYFHFCVNAT